MLTNGYIKEYRSLLSWGWFKDPFTAHLWEYLRLAANWDEAVFKGKPVRRGELVTSYPAMAEATGMSVQNVRTAIRHLKQTGEIEMKSFRDFSIVMIVVAPHLVQSTRTPLPASRRAFPPQNGQGLSSIIVCTSVHLRAASPAIITFNCCMSVFVCATIRAFKISTPFRNGFLNPPPMCLRSNVGGRQRLNPLCVPARIMRFRRFAQDSV